VFVLPDLTGVIVHDRYQNYDGKIFGHLVHQLCVQHLIRDCQDAAETYPDAHWPTQIREALQGLVHAANLAHEQNLPAIPAHIADPLISVYRHGVRIGLKDVARVPGRKQPKHRALLEDLRDREADILRFTTDLRIPPTSNQAERDLRPAKTQQKISGRPTPVRRQQSYVEPLSHEEEWPLRATQGPRPRGKGHREREATDRFREPGGHVD
jgi:hypothetical protein